jgi:hypothetical protein
MRICAVHLGMSALGPKADIRVLELLLRKMTVETHSAGRKSLL